MELAEFLMDVGTWFIAIGLTLGSFLGLMYVMAWLIDKGEWK